MPHVRNFLVFSVESDELKQRCGDGDSCRWCQEIWEIHDTSHIQMMTSLMPSVDSVNLHKINLVH